MNPPPSPWPAMQSWHTARELAQTAEYNRLAAEANQPGNPPREIIWTGEPLALQAFSHTAPQPFQPGLILPAPALPAEPGAPLSLPAPAEPSPETPPLLAPPYLGPGIIKKIRALGRRHATFTARQFHARLSGGTLGAALNYLGGGVHHGLLLVVADTRPRQYRLARPHETPTPPPPAPARKFRRRRL